MLENSAEISQSIGGLRGRSATLGGQSDGGAIWTVAPIGQWP
jgi:hypothetical protein